MNPSDMDQILRYLVKDMDPSEVFAFENRMKKDENLLIEVESYRGVLDKIKELRKYEPRQESLDEIMRFAKIVRKTVSKKNLTPVSLLEHKPQINKKNTSLKYFIRIAAGFIGLGLFCTIVYQVYFSNAINQNPSTDSFSSVTTVKHNNANVEAKTEKTEYQPWVDKNNYIELHSYQSFFMSDATMDVNNHFKTISNVSLINYSDEYKRIYTHYIKE